MDHFLAGIQKVLFGVQEEKSACKVFGILVVGETGTGKSTLVDNLLLTRINRGRMSYNSQTSEIKEYEATVQGVPVVLYDTPGLDDSRGGDRDESYLREMKAILDGGKIQLVVYCFKLSQRRMLPSAIKTFKAYHKIGVDWERTIVALTFADCLPLLRKEGKEEDFKMSQIFNGRVAEMQEEIKETLIEKVGVRKEVVQKVEVCPSTADPKEILPNGKRWFVPLSYHILKLLSPGATASFFRMRAGNIKGNSQDCVEKTYLFVQPPTEKLICAICQLLAHIPLQSSCCGTIYCTQCIETWMAKSKSCPTCWNPKQTDPPFTVFPDRRAQQEIECLVVHCPNWKELTGCDKKISLSEVEYHLKSGNGCPYEIVGCDHKCGHKDKRSGMKLHMKRDCHLRPEKCQFCTLISTHEHVTGAHLKECPNHPLTCPNKCGVPGLIRSTVPAHRMTCSLQNVECEYKHFGCTVVLPRNEMEGHLRGSVQDHLRMTKRKVEDQQLQKEKEMEACLQEQETRLQKAEEMEARLQEQETRLQKAEEMEARLQEQETRLQKAEKMEACLQEQERRLQKAEEMEARLQEQETRLQKAEEMEARLQEQETRLQKAEEMEARLQEQETRLQKAEEMEARLQEQETRLQKAESIEEQEKHCIMI